MKRVETMMTKSGKEIDVWFLALKELTKEELENLQKTPKTKIEKIKCPSKALRFYSRKVARLKLEARKYDYYEIYEDHKTYLSNYNVRILKER